MKLKRILQVGALSLALGLSSMFCPLTNRPIKEVAHNVMSNSGYNETSLIGKKLLDPKIYFSPGQYRGFMSQPENDDLDVNAVYLGLQENQLPISEYKPTNLTNSDEIVFHSIKKYLHQKEIFSLENILTKGLEKLLEMKKGEILSGEEVFGPSLDLGIPTKWSDLDLYHATVSYGKDDKGIYFSLYDAWDFGANSGYFKEHNDPISRTLSFALSSIGKPIHFYDRIYFSDNGITEDVLRNKLRDRNAKERE